MPEKEASQSKAAARIDFLALEMEIDREIDSLFVPAVQRAQETTEESKSTGEVHNFPESRPGPSIQEFEGSSGATFDLDTLQVEIDKEIDSLFVPAVKPDRNEGPVRIDNRKQPETMPGRSQVIEEQSLRVTRKAGGPSLGTFDGAALRAKYDESQPDNAVDSQRYHFHELSKLIEMFNAAYLRLDWEFSRENIQKFLAALKQLEPFAARSAEARSVLRILEVILKRLQERPHAVNSSLIQLIRDSQGLLAHVILLEGETGPHEKQRLKDLIERFQALRQRALAVKAEAKRGMADGTARPPSVYSKPQPLPAVQPARILSERDRDSLHKFPELMEKAWRSLSENLDIIDTQIARLRQIETILAKTPALVPIAQRLNGIGRALEDQVDTVRDKRGSLIDKISRIKKPETGRSYGELKPQKPEDSKSLPQTAPQSHMAGRVIPHLIALDGHTLRLPASCVLRVAQSSEKKGLKILKRGYATLADFKPYLRGIKSEVLGEWAKLPGKNLRSYKFELVALDSFNQAEAGGQMAVLASDGQKHAIMFAEKVDFIADAGIEAVARADGPPCQVVETLSHLLAPVFEPCGQPAPASPISSARSKEDQS